MKISILALLILTILDMVHAATLSVALDGSQAYTSIQAAIEAANNGDTVLVYPGRYFENIDYIGKSITVCSLESTTNNSTFISSTIIDGNQNGSCVAFRNAEQNATLRGFTITNGIGEPIYAGELRKGGGVFILQAIQVNLINCLITENRSGRGGGIYSIQSSLFLSGLQIHNNYALANAGGICLDGGPTHYPTILFDSVNRCSVYSNYSANPVDIRVTDIMSNLQINLDMFTVNTPDRFYIARHSNTAIYEQYDDTVDIERAYRDEVNHDLFVSPSGNDNNSGLSPSQAMKSITKATHRIAGDSLNVKTVHVLQGTYVEGATDQILPIPLKSNVNIIGEGSGLTTIAASSPTHTNQKLMFYGDRCANITLSGFTISSTISEGNMPIGLLNLSSNISILDIVVHDMVVRDIGAVFIMDCVKSRIESLVIKDITTPEKAVYVSDTKSAVIRNSIFENIHSTYSSPDTPGDDSWGGSVIDIWVSDSLSVENCEFRNISVVNNQSTFHITLGYGFTTPLIGDITINNCLFENIRTNGVSSIGFHTNRYGEYQVSNCTFYENYGLAAAVGVYGKVDMRNNIFSNHDAANEIVMHRAIPDLDMIGFLDFDYNCIPGGEASIYNTDPRNTVIYGLNNLETDPQFASINVGSPEYLHLAASSPCINTGTPDISALQLLPYDLAGNWRVWDGRIDMGCYEFGSIPYVDNDDPITPSLVDRITATNYPNPFNPSTTIAFSLPLAGRTTLDIYNLKGQKVRQLLNANLPSGSHKAVWDGSNDNNQPVSSGIYFYRVCCADQAFTGKMILAK